MALEAKSGGDQAQEADCESARGVGEKQERPTRPMG